MNAREITREVRLKRWMEIVNARNASGETIKKWCENQGINPKTYHYWQNQLRIVTLEHMAMNQTDTQPTLLPQGFAKVKVSGNTQKQLLEELTNQNIVGAFPIYVQLFHAITFESIDMYMVRQNR